MLIPPSDLQADVTRSTPNLLAAASTVTQPPSVPRAFLPKYQYRVVFKEVGEALHDVEDIGVVLKVAEYCLFGELVLNLARVTIIDDDLRQRFNFCFSQVGSTEISARGTSSRGRTAVCWPTSRTRGDSSLTQAVVQTRRRYASAVY